MTRATIASLRVVVQLAVAIFFLSAIVAERAAMADLVSPGFDLYQTPPPVGPFASSANFESQPLPVDFFSPGSQPFFGTVYFTGQPLGGSFPGNTDTVVARNGSLLIGESGTIPIEIVALNLVSVAPITVTSESSPPTFWDVRVTIPTSTAPPSGESQVQHADPGGGNFTGQLTVQPLFIFTFTPVDNPTHQLTEGIVNPLQIDLSSWSHSPAPLDAHNGTYPAGNFYAGVNPLGNLPSYVVASGQVLSLALLPATTAAIPEPRAWLMLGVVALGAGGLSLARRQWLSAPLK